MVFRWHYGSRSCSLASGSNLEIALLLPLICFVFITVEGSVLLGLVKVNIRSYACGFALVISIQNHAENFARKEVISN